MPKDFNGQGGFFDDDQDMFCSFCGKSRSQVSKLIAGPDGVCICDECVRTCRGMIEGEYFDAQDAQQPAAGACGRPAGERSPRCPPRS